MIEEFRSLLVCATLLSMLSGPTMPAIAQAVPVIDVPAAAETVPAQDAGDAADDAEIWRNPTDPQANRIFATDKKAGLFVLNLKGEKIAFFPVGRLNNVDLRDGSSASRFSRSIPRRWPSRILQNPSSPRMSVTPTACASIGARRPVFSPRS